MQKTKFAVIRINGNPSDTYAAPVGADLVDALNHALELAMPDPNDVAHYRVVEAFDAGEARIAAVAAGYGWRGLCRLVDKPKALFVRG